MTRRQTLAFQAPLMGLFLGMLLQPAADAAPRIIEEQVKLEVPGPSDQFLIRVAISGNALLVVGRHGFADEQAAVVQQRVYLFERSNTAAPWSFVRTLYETDVTRADHTVPLSVALQGSIAAVQEAATLLIFERGSTGWTQVARLEAPGMGAAFQPDTEIDAGTIVATGQFCQWRSFRKNASGVWTRVGNFPLQVPCSGTTGDADISGNRIVLGRTSADTSGPVFASSVLVFESPSATAPSATITSPVMPDLYFASTVAVEGDSIVAGGAQPKVVAGDLRNSGLHVFTGSSSIGWNYAANLAPADTFRMGPPSSLDMLGGLIAAAHPFDPHRGLAAGAVAVHRRNNDGTFAEIARLVASDGAPPNEDFLAQNLGNDVQISGRTIAAAANRAVYIFQLPTSFSQPGIIHDNFGSGNAANWTPQAGSSFSVVSAGSTRVYRQSSLAGDAASLRTNMDWQDQSIQVDVRPRAFDGRDRWFGVAVRYLDADNFYYVTVRSTNVIQLKRMVNGTFETLASAPLPVTLNRNSRLSLEAVGTRLRAHVDGRLAVEATDSALLHGSAGVMMYKTRADYDNVVISPSPLFTIRDDDFNNLDRDYIAERWTLLDEGEWEIVLDTDSSEATFVQHSLAGDARALTGSKTGYQSVQIDARPTAFGAGQGRWFGLIARYVDENNYYYLTVRNENTLSLRKLVNRQIVVLGTTPLEVVAGRTYRVRLEAIGSSLRAYVDNELKLERTDSSFTEGRYGLATFKAAVEHDNFLVTQQ